MFFLFTITPVRQDIKSPDGNPANNVHAEPQTLRDLSDRRGNHTIAVDQAPCGADKHNCAAAIKNTGNTRVIVPEDINKADRKTKSAAVKAAEGKTSVRPKEVDL